MVAESCRGKGLYVVIGIEDKEKVRQYFKKLEKRRLPESFDYSTISGLRKEAQQKLNIVQPVSIGQASRISGVSPADISVLLVYLESFKSNKE